MRALIALASCALIAGCSSGDSQESAAAPASGDTSATPASSLSGDSLNPCNLLSDAEVLELTGDAVGPAKPGDVSGLPNCQWETANGRYVQTIQSTASDWARALPEGIRAIEASGLYTDAENMRKLREAAALVEAGQDIDSDEACSLFSEMAEMQGRPPGSPSVVSVAPTMDNPQAVTGQMCTDGTFISVMVADVAGLEEPLPVGEIGQALESAHRRSLT